MPATGLLSGLFAPPRRLARRWLAGGFAVTLSLASAACSGDASPTDAARTSPVKLRVDQHDVLVDAPLRVTVTGLKPGQRVTVKATAADSSATSTLTAGTFAADKRGEVDLRRDRSRSGSYTGVMPMGLFWPIPADGSSGDQRVRLSVVAGGRTLASTSIRRRPRAPGVSVRHLRPNDDGVYGTYYGPADTKRTRPAVLIFGGSEGGLYRNFDLEAALLGSHGYPALALAYFGEDGLPGTLSQIPLEYFAKAMQWLAHQPGVDPTRLIVQGTSRGSEAALLMGVHYPDLVHGVIALSAANQAICSYPGCSGPAWTMHGKPLPYTSAATEVSTAVIPVEKINGPILTVCGGADTIWPSCRMEHAIQTRLNQHHFRYNHLVLTYPEAGHAVGLPAPYAYGDAHVSNTSRGAANRIARGREWPQLLAFVSHTRASD